MTVKSILGASLIFLGLFSLNAEAVDHGILCGDLTSRGFKISSNGRAVMKGFDYMGVPSMKIMNCESENDRPFGFAQVNTIFCRGDLANVRVSVTTYLGTITGQVYSRANIPVFNGVCLPYSQ